MQSETIAAIATGPAAGGIGIVRLSGSDSLAVLAKVFMPVGKQSLKPRRMTLGRLSGADGRLLDVVLAVYFKAPFSFTGEDAAEIHCHGGSAVLALALESVLVAGARLAEPGEFTKRAFLNNKMELTQAEAVADLIAAQSAAEVKLAARQLEGGLKDKLEPVSNAVLSALAALEAELDFSDDGHGIDLRSLQDNLKLHALAPLNDLLNLRRQGRIFKDGLKMALAGAPNAGKSSLFNALLGQKRALVSDRPGTTRDYLTAESLWQGLRVELADTAGLSAIPVDDLDAQGQALAKERLAEADAVLWVHELGKANSAQDGDLAALLPPGRAIMVINKIDLAVADSSYDDFGLPVVLVSAKNGTGLEDLKQKVLALAGVQPNQTWPDFVPSLRHQAALENALSRLNIVFEAIELGQPPEIVALELRGIMFELGVITGRFSPDNILDEIFSRFCIGK